MAAGPVLDPGIHPTHDTAVAGVAHERHDGVEVMAVEGVVEPLHDVDGAAGLGHCSRRTKYPDTRHPRFPSRVGTTVSTTCRPPETSVLYCSSTYWPGGALGGSVVYRAMIWCRAPNGSKGVRALLKSRSHFVFVTAS